jgi:hypothetical protein
MAKNDIEAWMTSYPVAKAAKALIERRHIDACFNMRKYAAFKNDFGMVPDSVKWSNEWQNDYAEYMAAFKSLRDFNAAFVRKFHKEIRAEMRNRR